MVKKAGNNDESSSSNKIMMVDAKYFRWAIFTIALSGVCTIVLTIAWYYTYYLNLKSMSNG